MIKNFFKKLEKYGIRLLMFINNALDFVQATLDDDDDDDDEFIMADVL